MQKIRFNESNPKLPELCRTVKEICKVLPTLDVKGDNKTVFVDEHSNGKVIRAKSKGSSGVGSASEGDAAIYDGPWAFSDYVDNNGVKYLRINGGYFIRNGLYVPMNMRNISYLYYQDFDLANTVISNSNYYVHIYQEWDKTYMDWKTPELRITTTPPPQSDTTGTIYGYCLLGYVYKTTSSGITTYNWKCYEQPLPIMFVVGRCIYEN